MRPSRSHGLGTFVSRALWLATLAAAASGASACGSNSSTGTTAPTPTLITETFDGTLTVNGAVTHPFGVLTTGTVTAQLSAADPTDATVGLSLGTWNGALCQVVLPNDAAVVGTVVTGAATATGNYCARIHDVGKLTQAIAYQIIVTHY